MVAIKTDRKPGDYIRSFSGLLKTFLSSQHLTGHLIFEIRCSDYKTFLFRYELASNPKRQPFFPLLWLQKTSTPQYLFPI